MTLHYITLQNELYNDLYWITNTELAEMRTIKMVKYSALAYIGPWNTTRTNALVVAAASFRSPSSPHCQCPFEDINGNGRLQISNQ